ncbi:hypothetical protein GCM10022197_13380 [Microlunatus spumicola]|uniref:Mce-associated membrane protein n=1 Tax=Microlunatus spumicola TaxID=81499 RepID=A0ABP6WZY5_9ACTN
MSTLKKTLAVTACTAVLLSGCGGGADSSGAPAASGAAPTSAAAPAAAPSTAAPSTPAATPSADPSAAAPQVKAAAEKFVSTALTFGYPDKSADAYFDRVEPLMTKSGFARQKKDLRRVNDKAFQQVYAQRVRVTIRTTSPIKVTAGDETRATAQGSYRLLRQQRAGGKWKTLDTDDDKTAVKLTLVLDDGAWLVDTAT